MGRSAAIRIGLALVLCLAGATVSGLLLLQHHGETSAVAAVNEVCGDGQTSGCADVARSSWSSFAGLPVAAYGCLFYLSLALVLALGLLGPGELREPLGALALAGLVFGLVVDLFLLGVQAVAIKAFCSLCIVTYVLSAAAAFALLPSWKALPGLLAAARRPEGRLASSGWLLGTLALAGAVLAWNVTLGYRGAQRQALLLGRPLPTLPSPTPAPLPTPPPATPATTTASTLAVVAKHAPAAPAIVPPTAADPQDAKLWRERAQKLQETLDDPRKLEAYFAERAQREFDAATPTAIDVQGTPARGPATAPVKVVEFSDFLCPFCRNLAAALTQFIPQAGGRVVVYFKNYPLDVACNPNLKQSVHPGACNVALGAVCAQRQGKFEVYHDRVFATELRNPQPSDVVRLAGEAGLNATALQGCLDDPQTKQALSAQIAEAARLGVTATPTLYVDGKKLPRLNDFVAVVDKEARKKGFPPLGP